MQITKLESSPGLANTQQEVTNVNKEDDESFAKSSVGCDLTASGNEDEVVKILGMNWNTLTDEIFFNFSDPNVSQNMIEKKRRVFGPLQTVLPI